MNIENFPPYTLDIGFVVGSDFNQLVALGMPSSGMQFEAYVRLEDGTQQDFDVQNLDPIAGHVNLNMPYTTTSGLMAGVFDWQLSFVDNWGTHQTFYQGLCTIKDNV